MGRWRVAGRRSLPALVLLAAILLPAVARADAPSLQVAPLQYTGNLTAGKVANGYIDVSNPTDTNIQVTASIQGFRQTGINGDLQFFANPDLTNGIKVGLAAFSLGPREALRDVFSIDPAKLPQGGVYAAIFFRTQTLNQSSTSSFVNESANVGTLLILTNGGPGAHRGAITGLKLPFWQFGGGLHGGNVIFQNTDRSHVAVAFTPILATTVLPWGRATKFTAGLVMPGITRQFTFTRPGSYLGLLPVTVTDSATGAHRTVWVVADTGVYLWLVPLLIIAIFLTLKFKPYESIKRHHHKRGESKPPAVTARV